MVFRLAMSPPFLRFRTRFFSSSLLILCWLQPTVSSADPVLPLCISAFKGHFNLFLNYNSSEKYHRKIEGFLSRTPCSRNTAHFFNSNKFDHLPQYIRRIPEQPKYLFGAPLSVELQERFAQAQLGAMTYRSKEESADFFAQTYLSRGFTISDNIFLTKHYGHGFAGDVYRAWVNGQPRNQFAKKILLERLSNFSSAGNQAKGANYSQRKKTTLFVSMGIGWSSPPDRSSPQYVKDFLSLVQRLDLDVFISKRDPFGSLEKNIDTSAQELSQLLSQGKDVILFGLCKGAPELLLAATRVLSPYLDRHRNQTGLPSDFGKIRAAISLSGMYSGIIFADALKKYPFISYLKKPLLFLSAWDRLARGGAYLNVLENITTAKVEALLRPAFESLPQDITYLNLSGTLPYDGLLKNDISAMAPFINANRKYNFALGANDGFIQYPGNTLPLNIAPHSYDFIFESSHMLFDGTFERLSFKDKNVSLFFYKSLLDLIFEDAFSKYRNEANQQ